MFKPTLIPSHVASALAAVANYNGVQTGLHDEPLFELWTLKVALTPTMLPHFTFARDSILAVLQPVEMAA